MMTEKFFFNAVLISWFVLSVIVFITLFFITAPYGRHTKRGWGFSLNNRLAWLIMETPAVIVFLIFFIIGSNPLLLTNIIFLLLWEAHYIQRAFIYPFQLQNVESKMPISIVFFGVLFNILNGYLNGRYLFTLAGNYPVSWLYDVRFLIGVVLFVLGYFINRSSDHILSNVKKTSESDYRVINEGFFNLISSPNYLGEIFIWIGWAIATWSLAGLAFACWTIANLVPRARAHHDWYKKNFPGYPAERRALIPKLW